MKIIEIVGFCSLISIFASCSKHENLTEIINSQIDSLTHAVTTAQPDQILRVSENINSYVELYPDDSLSSKYLFELARIYQSNHSPENAISRLEIIHQKYPDSKEASVSLFMEGFIYANTLNNQQKAREMYELYLKNYGSENEKLSRDVETELKNLGKSADEILNEIISLTDTLK